MQKDFEKTWPSVNVGLMILPERANVMISGSSPN